MPNTAVSSVFAITPVIRPHTAACGRRSPARNTASATMPRIPMAAPRILAIRWLARNSGVVTYLAQAANWVCGGGWWVKVP